MHQHEITFFFCKKLKWNIILIAWKISTGSAKKPAERVSSYIRKIKGYKTKNGKVPRPPIIDKCLVDSTTKFFF